MVVNWINEYNALRDLISQTSKITWGPDLHILKARKTRNECSSSFLDDLEHTADIRRATREGCRNTCFRLRERNAHICGFERAAIVSTVSTECNGEPNGLQPLDQLVLLVGGHAGENLRLEKHLSR